MLTSLLRRVSNRRQQSLSHVCKKGFVSLLNGYTTSPSLENDSSTISKPNGTSQSVYIHHTTIGVGINSAAVTLGLIHSLSVLRPGVGYYRPIDSTSHGGHRSQLVKDVYKLEGPVRDMFACTQEEAIALISQDREDDLIELIIKSYEAYKARHDFVVVEGTSLKLGMNAGAINGSIASALGSPTLFVTDAISAYGDEGYRTDVNKVNWEEVDWESSVYSSILDHERIMRKEHVDVVGSLIYRAPKTSRGTSALRRLLEDHRLPFPGAIPTDAVLQSLQVQDVQRILSAEFLYGNQLESSLSAGVTETVVASVQLEDLLDYLPTQQDPTNGALIVAHVTRPDILLGLLALHDNHGPTSLAGVVLTGGKAPPPVIDALIRNRPGEHTLPVLVSGMSTFDTCVALSKAQPEIHSNSIQKIQKAQVLFDNHIDLDILKKILFQERELRMHPKLFQHTLFQTAKSAQQHIVLPEGDESRTIQAAGEILRRGLGKLTLLGNRTDILTKAKQLRVHLEGANIVDPHDSPDLQKYAELLYNARKHKGMTLDSAQDQLVGDVNFFGTAMVAAGDADGMVSGAIHTTANTVRPALQVIKTLPGTPIVSSVFFMCLPDKVLVYGDCAINTDPTSEELATIAINSADTAAAFGIEPRVAMLSYATGDSNAGPLIQKVIDATRIAKEWRPDLAIEGPLQYDAAVNPETARTKMKGKHTDVAGKATVLIFPDLNTGNNTYKAVQQSTGAIAMGPLLQGLRKPVNDLSRGCTVQDIVTTIALTAVQAQGMKQLQGR